MLNALLERGYEFEEEIPPLPDVPVAKTPPEVLASMLDSVNAARAYLHKTKKVEFLENPKLQSALMYELLLVRACIGRLPEKYKEAHPEVPWRAIYGMGAKLIHDFDKVDLEMLWQVAEKHLPKFQKQIRALQKQEPQ